MRSTVKFYQAEGPQTGKR